MRCIAIKLLIISAWLQQGHTFVICYTRFFIRNISDRDRARCFFRMMIFSSSKHLSLVWTRLFDVWWVDDKNKFIHRGRHFVCLGGKLCDKRVYFSLYKGWMEKMRDCFGMICHKKWIRDIDRIFHFLLHCFCICCNDLSFQTTNNQPFLGNFQKISQKC